MRINNAWILLLLLFSIANFSCNRHSPDTVVEIRGSKFYINGVPTYKGKTWNGNSIDGLLFNSRMVQGIFDDENPETRDHWRYPDTGEWDPERNTDEFRVAMEEWYRRGILAFTLNMQGGSPTGYDISEVLNSAFRSDGSLKPEYMARLDRILERSDDLGMVVILGLFYFGQDQHLSDEQAVINAVDNTLEWLIKNRYRNVILEINNECDVDYDHQILQPGRVHELIERVKQTEADGYRLYAGTSWGGGSLPDHVDVSDFILMHGNGVDDPEKIREMVRRTRNRPDYSPQPIIFNEDDNYEFDQEDYNLKAAVESYASWGYFDYRREGEDYTEGFQSMPVDWGINSERKKSFFNKISEITGGNL